MKKPPLNAANCKWPPSPKCLIVCQLVRSCDCFSKGEAEQKISRVVHRRDRMLFLASATRLAANPPPLSRLHYSLRNSDGSVGQVLNDGELIAGCHPAPRVLKTIVSARRSVQYISLRSYNMSPPEAFVSRVLLYTCSRPPNSIFFLRL